MDTGMVQVTDPPSTPVIALVTSAPKINPNAFPPAYRALDRNQTSTCGRWNASIWKLGIRLLPTPHGDISGSPPIVE